ncbi:MAG TPA: c-type cytochrome [Anaerolineales bacterium]|nr:c-type cytochrome [Anaerolineales bacterium]
MRLQRISLIIVASALVLLLSACLGEASLPPLETDATSEHTKPALNPTLAASQNLDLFLGGQMPISNQVVPQIPHDLIGRSDCLMCHKQGVSDSPRIPDSHRGLESNTCQTCHAAPASADLSGAEMYTRVCARCHGENGEGSYGSALNTKSYLQSVTDEQIREAIVRGRGDSEMLSWGDLGLLTERQIDELVVFIRNWEATAPEQASTTAAEPADAARGDPSQGEGLFAQFCTGCHGLHGESSIGEDFILQAFVETADDEMIAHAVRDGAPGMPSFHALLTSDNINDILAFVRSW